MPSESEQDEWNTIVHAQHDTYFHSISNACISMSRQMLLDLCVCLCWWGKLEKCGKTFACRNIIFFCILRCYRRRTPDRRTNEWTNKRCIIDFLECTIREKTGWQEGVESSLKFILIHSPFQFHFLCNDNSFYFCTEEKTVSIFTAHRAMSSFVVEGWRSMGIIHSVMHFQTTAFWMILTPAHKQCLPFIY